MCKNIAFPQISFLSCINAICEIFPDDNVPSDQFPLERENVSEIAETTEGSNSSEHDADDNAKSIDEPADDQPNLDEQLARPIPDQDQDEIPEETSEQVSEQPLDQPLDLKKSNSFLNLPQSTILIDMKM